MIWKGFSSHNNSMSLWFLCYARTDPGVRMAGLREEPRGAAVLHKLVGAEACRVLSAAALVQQSLQIPSSNTMQIQDHPKLSAPGNIWLVFLVESFWWFFSSPKSFRVCEWVSINARHRFIAKLSQHHLLRSSDLDSSSWARGVQKRITVTSFLAPLPSALSFGLNRVVGLEQL